MVDTIVLTLTNDMFHITYPNKFNPSASWVLNENVKSIHRIQSKQNPTKKELRNGIYKPRLTLSNRINNRSMQELMLKIDLSLPKLFFGNNFAELQYKDFKPVVNKLVSILAEMGINTTADMLAKAPVAAIHYSKNIKLTDGSTPYYYIQKIKEANVKLSLDVNQTDYRNEGHSYKWHCNSYEVVFYDKIKDLEQAKISTKRSLEKDNELQVHLIKTFQKRKMLEFLRMEVRLTRKPKIKQLFKKLGITSDLTFKKLFKPAIAKKVLLHYLDEIEKKRPLLLDYKPSSAKGLLVDLLFNNPDLTPKYIMQAYGLKQALNEMNLRELRTIFEGKNKRNWYSLLGDAAKIKLPGTLSPLRNLREQLIKFETNIYQ